MQSDRPPATSIPLRDAPEGRWLCLGGSFNPIHFGHLITARAAAESLGFAGVRLIPSAQNPLKSTFEMAPAADRLAMCRLAVEGDPFFMVDPIEIDRPPPSYTIDTVTALAAGDDRRVPWLIGTDLLPHLHRWHRLDALNARVEFVVMERAGQSIDLSGVTWPTSCRVVTVPQIEISATDIRRRIRAQHPIHYLTPAPVVRHLRERHLYAVTA